MPGVLFRGRSSSFPIETTFHHFATTEYSSFHTSRFFRSVDAVLSMVYLLMVNLNCLASDDDCSVQTKPAPSVSMIGSSGYHTLSEKPDGIF